MARSDAKKLAGGALSEALAVQLASGATAVEAAAAAGCSTRTVFRRLEDEAFRQRVRELRDRLIGEAVDRLLG